MPTASRLATCLVASLAILAGCKPPPLPEEFVALGFERPGHEARATAATFRGEWPWSVSTIFISCGVRQGTAATGPGTFAYVVARAEDNRSVGLTTRAITDYGTARPLAKTWPVDLRPFREVGLAMCGGTFGPDWIRYPNSGTPSAR